jgi:hypothetical protein
MEMLVMLASAGTVFRLLARAPLLMEDWTADRMVAALAVLLVIAPTISVVDPTSRRVRLQPDAAAANTRRRKH